MRLKLFTLVPALSVFFLVLAGCGGGNGATPTASPTPTGAPSPATTPIPPDEKGKAIFAVSDDAVDIGSVNKIEVAIESVQVHSVTGAWNTVSTETQTFDLLELRARGIAQLLAEAELDAGTYDQMRLNVSQVVVVDTEGRHEAKLPSNIIQLKGDLEVLGDSTATANFDFIADQSLHLTGEGRFIFAPVVQLETRANAQAEVKSNNEVEFSGGMVKTNIRVGMNAEGSVDVGLRITPDAVLSITAAGNLVQTRGTALVSGAIKSVNTADGTITIETKSGNEITLYSASDSQITVDGSAKTFGELRFDIGAEVTAQYNAETKAMSKLAAGADSQARAEAAANISISGVIKAVDTVNGTITVITDSGNELQLAVDSNSKLQLGGSLLSGLLGLEGEVGSRIEADYDADSRAVASLDAEAEAAAAVTGMLKSVDSAGGTVTVATQAGVDITLNVASNSRLLINGSLATMAALKAMIGSEVTLEYSQITNAVSELNARGTLEGSTTVTGILESVNPAGGTITLSTVSGEQVTLNVTSGTSLVADGSITSLVNLLAKLGTHITAEVDSQTNVATSVNTQARANASAGGALKSVNTAQGTLTIATEAGTDLVLKVTTDTQIKVDSAISTLTKLAAEIGSRIRAEYNAETDVAASVHSQAQAQTAATANGTLKSVDTAAGTITVTTEAGADLTLKITSNTKVLVGSSLATLGKLETQIGSQVTVEYNSQTSVASSISAEAQGSAIATVTGTISSVNLLAGTITIAAGSGQQLILSISSTTEILLNGSASTLMRIAAEINSSVTALYNVETQTAISLNVQG